MKTNNLIIIPIISALFLAGCSQNSATSSISSVSSETISSIMPASSEATSLEKEPSFKVEDYNYDNSMVIHYDFGDFGIHIMRAHFWEVPDYQKDDKSMYKDGYKVVAVDYIVTNFTAEKLISTFVDRNINAVDENGESYEELGNATIDAGYEGGASVIHQDYEQGRFSAYFVPEGTTKITVQLGVDGDNLNDEIKTFTLDIVGYY